MLKNKFKTSKFNSAILIVVIILLLYCVLVARSIFASISLSNEIAEEVLNAPSPHLNKQNLDKAYAQLFETEFIGLDLN